MAKKSISEDDLILNGLQKAVDALPSSKPMLAKSGLFPETDQGRSAVRRAVQEGLLTEKEKASGKGKNAKSVAHGILTAMGIARVFDATSPKAALEKLEFVAIAISNQERAPNPEQFRADFGLATEKCIKAISDGFTHLQAEVMKNLDRFVHQQVEAMKSLLPTAAVDVDHGAILNAIKSAADRVKSPIYPAVPTESTPVPVAQPVSAAPMPPAKLEPAATDVEREMVDFVTGWANEKSVGCQFDTLWQALKGKHATLTIGAFHDALRKLHDAERVRLRGWPRMLDDIPEPELALFISSTVMYYAQPPG